MILTDLFLSSLGDAFKVNVIVFQSHDTKCWVVNLWNEENPFKETLYFARSLSLHTDAVIPCEKYEEFQMKVKYIFKNNSITHFLTHWGHTQSQVFRECNFPVN